MSTVLDFEIYRKTTPTYELEIKIDGEVKDITLWTVYFTVKAKMSDADADAKISYDVTSHSDPTNGKTIITLTSTDTDLVGSYYYDIVAKDDSGNVYDMYNGRIRFTEIVTTRA